MVSLKFIFDSIPRDIESDNTFEICRRVYIRVGGSVMAAPVRTFCQLEQDQVEFNQL